ncbi:MAG: C-terminal binding protein [Bacteroidetes bacterium]|nr:C-terminal binding protein [Bacteroidota bacterium]
MNKKIIFKITDYIERDLKWEEQECKKLGIDFFHYQMRDASPSDLIKNFKDADIVLTNMADFTAEVMDGLENVKVLLRHGIGYDKVDVEAATRNGIIFANEATASSDDVAEHAIMLILETFRKKKLQDKVLKRWIYSREWSSEDIYPMHRMKGKTLGIIGCGNIGSLVLKKMSGFGMKILVSDPYLSEERYKELGIEHVPFDDVIKESDIITIHVPVTNETRGMFHLEKFRLMKKTAVIINTARGPVLSTDDLITALKTGIISGAGIDVYETEPPHPDSEIITMDNVILSPHIAWYSEEGGWDIRYMIMDDVKSFIEGKPPKFVINPDVLKKSRLGF